MDHMTLEMVDPLSTLSAERSQTIKHGLVINGIKSAHILVCQVRTDVAPSSRACTNVQHGMTVVLTDRNYSARSMPEY